MSGQPGAIDPLLSRSVTTGRSIDTVVVIGDLYRVHGERLTGLAASVTFDRALAEEITHDAFVGLQRRFASVEDSVGYLQRSVLNRSISALRRRRVARRYEPPRLQPVTNPEYDVAWAAVVRLPVRQRTVVVLRYWHDMSEADIAAAVGWPAGTVKSTLHRALKRLRQEVTTWSD